MTRRCAHGERSPADQLRAALSPFCCRSTKPKTHRSESITKRTSDAAHAESSGESDLRAPSGVSFSRICRANSEGGGHTMLELSTCSCVSSKSVRMDFMSGGKAYYVLRNRR